MLIIYCQNMKKLVLNFSLIDLQDKKLSMDGMHLTHEGNKIIAEEIYKNIRNNCSERN